MVYINVVLTVKDEADVEAVRDLLTEHGRLSRAEPGCVRFEVYHSQADRRVFVLNEHWESQAALDAHRQAKAIQTIYVPQVLPKAERVAHPSDLVAG
ncbi:MAG: antibiotic biosynthesis monooxygenase [Planctomycetes bacterium]|nr:antibiotic biosynthesis monooxygenase [Planctomycetota bacterium]